MRVENLTDAELLDPIRHPDDRQGVTNIHTVEGCILANNNYRWYYGIGRVFKPMTIGEIGVRFGYSLWALATGAHTNPIVYAWDNESYITGSIAWANQHLAKLCEEVSIHQVNSQAVSRLPCEYDYFDLFSVDGDHTDHGCWHDLELCWPYVRPGGLILVDDIDYSGADGRMNLRPVVERFCKHKAIDFLYLPTTRGLALLIKPENDPPRI